MGVVLAAAHADKLADPAGIRLHRLAGLDWAGFPRSEAPVWYAITYLASDAASFVHGAVLPVDGGRIAV